MEVKAIFLDFYGTVVHEETESLIRICHKMKECSSLDLSVEEIGSYWMKDFNQLLLESHGEMFMKQRELSATSLRNTLNKFQSNANEEELLELMFTHWKKPAIYDDAIEFFKHNKVPIYILSNVDQSDIGEALKYLDLVVEGIVTSEVVKAYKPNSKMFTYGLNHFGFRPEEVIHVGDSLTSDVLGANQVGIKSVWLNRGGKHVGEIKPDYVIKNLHELLNLSSVVEMKI